MEKRIVTKTLAAFAIFLLVSLNLIAQVPQSFNYQAVLRDGSGLILQDEYLTMKFTIHQASPTGTVIYEEVKDTTTNNFGLVNLQIGKGIPTTGTFSAIPWEAGPFFLQVRANAGAGYIDLGTTQFYSVPFALVADTVLHGGGGGAGDDWGTQVAQTDATLSGDGTTDNPLGIAQQDATDGQVLAWDGSTWSPADVESGASLVILDTSNYLTLMPGDDQIITIHGTLILEDDYTNLGDNNTFVSGGTIDGDSLYTVTFGENNVISNVNFMNIDIEGTNTQFLNCTFTNVTTLPDGCSLTGCTIMDSELGTDNAIGYVTNSHLSNSEIPDLQKLSNSSISGTTIGSSIYLLDLASNNTFMNSVVYLSGAFNGNNCTDTRIMGTCSELSAVNISGNIFTSNTLTTNTVEIDVTGSNRYSVIISNNSFYGNSTSPVGEHIKITGTYSGTRYITKISNNIAEGGAPAATQFINISTSGPVFHTVSDNDYMYTGTLGVSTTTYITERNNIGY
jgi:hypothetical protein